MHLHLENETVVITGAAQGIGYAIAENIVKNGAKITILLDINEERGSKAAKNLNYKYGENKAEFIHCDVTKDLDSVSKKLFEKHGYISVLINNAGILDETSVRNALEVDLIALMEWTMKFWEHMRTDRGGKGGTIINMSSIFGFRVTSNFPFVKAAKYGVMGFSKTLGHKYNFEKYGVRIVVLCPGKTDTPMALASNFQGAILNSEESLEALRMCEKLCEKQPPEVVGAGAVEVLLRADSGTAWLIEDGKPAQQLE